MTFDFCLIRLTRDYYTSLIFFLKMSSFKVSLTKKLVKFLSTTSLENLIPATVATKLLRKNQRICLKELLKNQ